MIVYSKSYKECYEDIVNLRIMQIIVKAFKERIGKYLGNAEYKSINESICYLDREIFYKMQMDPMICVTIEYEIPQYGERIDIILSGINSNQMDQVLLIEVKQWSENIKIIKKSASECGIQVIFANNQKRVCLHPSEQVLNYKNRLKNTLVECQGSQAIQIATCSYMHNYDSLKNSVILDKAFSLINEESPVYTSSSVDNARLIALIKKMFMKGNGNKIIERMDGSLIKPSLSLSRDVCSIFFKDKRFVLSSEQLIAYEEIKAIVDKSDVDLKKVFIVKGGPGTGKSVIAVQLLAHFFSKAELLDGPTMVKYCVPNKSFVDFIKNEISRYPDKKKANNVIDNIFKSSISFVGEDSDSLLCTIVDESHSLKKLQNMYRGKDQVEDVIRVSRFSVFFLDERQKTGHREIGDERHIIDVARQCGVAVDDITIFELNTQFRCAGGNDYIVWLNDMLEEKFNVLPNFGGYEVKIFDSPSELKEWINDKNSKRKANGLGSRIVAGYAWPWHKKPDGSKLFNDVSIPEYDFAMPWNANKKGVNWPSSTKWSFDDRGINQVGCVHTVKGLEFDFIGVIIGDDLEWDGYHLKANADEFYDRSGKIYSNTKGNELLDIILNQYRILLSRGINGVGIFCKDKKLADLLKTYLR